MWKSHSNNFVIFLKLEWVSLWRTCDWTFGVVLCIWCDICVWSIRDEGSLAKRAPYKSKVNSLWLELTNTSLESLAWFLKSCVLSIKYNNHKKIDRLHLRNGWVYINITTSWHGLCGVRIPIRNVHSLCVFILPTHYESWVPWRLGKTLPSIKRLEWKHASYSVGVEFLDVNLFIDSRLQSDLNWSI